MLVIAYVDDLLFLGTEHMQGEIDKIREFIKMDDPAPLRKYLDCTHRVSKTKQKNGDMLTTCEYDMCDALQAAVQDYVGRTGKRLKVADSPYPPDIDKAQQEQLLNRQGEDGAHSASFLMRL